MKLPIKSSMLTICQIGAFIAYVFLLEPMKLGELKFFQCHYADHTKPLLLMSTDSVLHTPQSIACIP